MRIARGICFIRSHQRANFSVVPLEILQRANIEKLNHLQEASFDHILERKDTLIKWFAGSGKTLAYLLPLEKRVSSTLPLYNEKQDLVLSKYSPRVIILAPTLHLRKQIYELLLNLHKDKVWLISASSTDLRTSCERPDFYVGTPFQIFSMTKGMSLTWVRTLLSRTETVVFDEADALIRHTVTQAIASTLQNTYSHDYTPAVVKSHNDAIHRIQKVFVCATSSIELEHYLLNPIIVSSSAQRQNLTHSSLETNSKMDKLREEIEKNLQSKTKWIVFCNSISRIGKIRSSLDYLEECKVLSAGEMGKTSSREIEEFISGTPSKLEILIASDFYSRGIDFKGVSRVIHFDLAPNYIIYAHRAGRAGRSTETGESISLLFPKEIKPFAELMKRLNITK